MKCELCNKNIYENEIIHSNTWQVCEECYNNENWCRGCGELLDEENEYYENYCKDCY